MAVLGGLVLGLVTAVLASGLRRGEEGRGVLARRYAIGMVGGLFGGLVAVLSGVGPIEDFLHTGTGVIAVGGAVLAVVVYELVRASRARRGVSGVRGGGWAGRRAGGESEKLDRNW
jgi:uncharacterized membrane protein YeaQ/YmgE (transglycosylase-associated protein family)